MGGGAGLLKCLVRSPVIEIAWVGTENSNQQRQRREGGEAVNELKNICSPTQIPAHEEEQ